MHFYVFHIDTSKTDKFNWKSDWHWGLLDHVALSQFVSMHSPFFSRLLSVSVLITFLRPLSVCFLCIHPTVASGRFFQLLEGVRDHFRPTQEERWRHSSSRLLSKMAPIILPSSVFSSSSSSTGYVSRSPMGRILRQSSSAPLRRRLNFRWWGLFGFLIFCFVSLCFALFFSFLFSLSFPLFLSLVFFFCWLSLSLSFSFSFRFRFLSLCFYVFLFPVLFILFPVLFVLFPVFFPFRSCSLSRSLSFCFPARLGARVFFPCIVFPVLFLFLLALFYALRF